MSKIVYVVKGSEDGILGVFSNKKAAWETAVNYVEQIDKIEDKSKIKKEFYKDGYANVYGIDSNGYSNSAEIINPYFNCAKRAIKAKKLTHNTLE